MRPDVWCTLSLTPGASSLNLRCKEGGRYLEGEGLLSKSQVFCGHKAAEEDVDPLSHTEGHGDHAIRTWNA